MTSNFYTPAVVPKGLRIVVVCLSVLMLLGVAPGKHDEPSVGAKGMPGALGTMEYKPTDWKGNVTTYWKDTDGVDPGVAGCHIGVTQDGKPNGRFFGEACLDDRTLIESNPGAGVIHPHANDLGHPDRFDCNVWCIGAKKATGGACKTVTASPQLKNGPPSISPCSTSARCECN